MAKYLIIYLSIILITYILIIIKYRKFPLPETRGSIINILTLPFIWILKIIKNIWEEL